MTNCVRIQYIWHDCFVVMTSDCDMIFDYWTDPTVGDNELPAFLRDRKGNKPLYVFVSHHHKDHFNRSIFEWEKEIPEIHYIISKDVAKSARHILSPTSIYYGHKPDMDKVTILTPGDGYKDSVISVVAFNSTDIGNSYLVETMGHKFFHAGDLNAWIWKDESTEAEVSEAINKYEEILDQIKSAAPHIDVAMFPVDSRIGTDYFIGAAMFVRAIFVDHFFPMHFGLGENVEQERYMLAASRTELYANQERGEYICLQAPYSSYQKAW